MSLHDSELSGATILPLRTVYGYRDQGFMLGDVPTKWQPRRVFCTETSDHADKPGIEYVVKYLQGRQGAAALISEVVCHAFMEAAGLNTLDAAIVEVSDRFAASYNMNGLPYRVQAGAHFGTVLRNDVQPGPPTQLDSLSDVQELIDIWVFDTWLMNIDREKFGNILMQPVPQQRWTLIPADQSDCFEGSRAFSSGEYMSKARKRKPASTCGILTSEALLANGGKAVGMAIERVRSVQHLTCAACERVPEKWWAAANVEPNELKSCLNERGRKLEEILNVERWEELGHGLDDATGGGYVLDI